VEGNEVTVAREVVRMNHHKSCLLCHAPADAAAVKADSEENELFVAPVPLPSEKLPRYSSSKADNGGLLVRIDVTYLRQDFSVMLPVKEAAPWPEMQRFDFLVRKRILTEEEAAELKQRLTPREGELTPYQKAAVRALRELTGRDLPAKADAWRKHLKLPAKRG
jgi:hypothetical protein